MAYTSQTFEDGKVLYASELNAMNAGIVEAQAANTQNAAAISQNTAAIEQILNDDGIPDYWDDPDNAEHPSYLSGKIDTIKNLQREGGKNCFTFAFITDVHYPSNLGKYSPAIAARIMNACDVRYTLNAGDTQTRGCYQTKEEILEENEKVEEMFAPVKYRLLQVEGNHDGSYCWSGGSGTAYVKQLNENEMFEEYYRINCLSGDLHFDANSNAFYVDDVSNKVRYIGLNSMNVPNKATDVNADGTAKYPKFNHYQFLQAQYDFLCNDALSTVPSDEWSVVVFGHSGIYNAGEYAVMVDVLSAYKNKTNCVVEYAGTAAGGPAYTNLAEPSDNATDTMKWINGYRIGSGGLTAQTGKTTTNPLEGAVGDVFYVKGVEFVAGEDRVMLSSGPTNSGQYAYVSQLPNEYWGYEYVDGVHAFTILKVGSQANKYFRCCFNTPADPSTVIITKNQPIVEAEHGYDYVSVNHDFTDAKGQFIAYFHGHDHQDADYTRDSIKDISTRSDGKEEYEEADRNDRVEGTITEQSFDVFTVNKAERKIFATKIGAGSDRVIDY